MTIRRAENKDIPNVLRLLSQVLEIHAESRPDIFIPGSTKYTAEELTELFRRENDPVYVATDETGTLLGYAFCALKEPPFANTMRPRRTMFIDDLCVDESCRGMHIGEALFHYVKQEALRLGCGDLTLNVWTGNDNAIRFYEKMGMQIREMQMELNLTTEKEQNQKKQ